MNSDPWAPGSRRGYLVSTGSAVAIAAIAWWLGRTVFDVSIGGLSSGELVGAVVLGLLLGGSAVAIHLLPTWREWWSNTVSLRLVGGLVVGLVIAVLTDRVPTVSVLGLVIAAAILVVGRTYAYVQAR